MYQAEICINISMKLFELFTNYDFDLPYLLEEALPVTKEEIDAIKAKWDEGKKPAKIATELGIKVDRVKRILTKFYDDRSGKRSTDTDVVELVKIDWDSGKKPEQIAANLGLSIGSVRSILNRFYPDRPNKVIQYSTALTDEERNKIADEFMDGGSPADIGRHYGLFDNTISGIIKSKIGEEEYDREMDRRRTIPGQNIKNKVTPEMLASFADQYRRGQTFTQISDKIDSVASTTISRRVRGLENWEEIKADHDRFAKIQGSGPATTNKTRGGEIDNYRSQGPGKKNTYRMLPSKQY